MSRLRPSNLSGNPGTEPAHNAVTTTPNGNGPSKIDNDYWRERLFVRRYAFPLSGASERDLAARIDHAGTGYWFPLGSADFDAAAVKARRIFETVIQRGWEECCRRFPRELIVGFEWCSNPILWTYATIHTVIEKLPAGVRQRSNAQGLASVLIVEEDAGTRRALEWSLNQHPGIRSVACESTASFDRIFLRCEPSLVLLNRKLAERLKFASPGQLAPIRDNVPALTYSLAADGDQLFVSTPGGAAGYLLKRVKPDRLLEPLLHGNSNLPGSEAKELLVRVKSYFKELLQPRPADAASGIDRLTRRENEVLGLLSKGCVDKEIAQTLGISAWTVHGHIKSIFKRLRVRTRTEAVVRYLEK
jgi:DNA-binding NarL/FixJ family response regulator